MKKLLIITLLLGLVCGCNSSKLNKSVDPEVKLISSSPNEFDYDTFVIENQIYRGTAFIADHKLITAKHLAIENFNYDLTQEDYYIFGNSEFPGLSLCDKAHSPHDFFIYMDNKLANIIYINEVSNNYYTGDCINSVIHGESGTPVFCTEHKKVVGLVSGFFIGYPHTILIQKLSPQVLAGCKD